MVMYCKSCLRQIKDDCLICPYCGKGKPQSRKILETDDLPLGYSQRKNKRLIVGITIVLAVLLLLTLAPNAIYRLKLQKFHNTIRDAIVTTEEVCSIIQDVWYDSIYEIDREHTRPYTQYKGRFYTDFEQSLRVLDASKYMHKQKEIISEHQDDVYKLYKGLRNYPDKYFDHYKCAGLMCETLDILVSLANSQNNLSYDEYEDLTQRTITAFWDVSIALDVYTK